MIVRVWRGVADTLANADAYVRHLKTKVFPSLAANQGHRGGRVLRRANAGRIEFLVMTRWDSMDAIREFAGDDPDRAVVEPEARAALSEYDSFVQHYEITHDSE